MKKILSKLCKNWRQLSPFLFTAFSFMKDGGRGSHSHLFPRSFARRETNLRLGRGESRDGRPGSLSFVMERRERELGWRWGSDQSSPGLAPAQPEWGPALAPARPEVRNRFAFLPPPWPAEPEPEPEPAITQCLHHLPTSSPSSWGTLRWREGGGLCPAQGEIPGSPHWPSVQGSQQGFIVSQIQFTGVKVGSLIQSLGEKILSGKLCSLQSV